MGNERLVLLGGADQTCLCLAIMNATLGPSRSSTAAWVQGQFELKHVPLQSAHPPLSFPANCHTGVHKHCCPSAGQNTRQGPTYLKLWLHSGKYIVVMNSLLCGTTTKSPFY